MITVKIQNIKELVHRLLSSRGFFVKETSTGSTRFLQYNPLTAQVHIYAVDINAFIALDMNDIMNETGRAAQSSTILAAKNGTLLQLLDPGTDILANISHIESKIGIPMVI